MVSVLNHFHCDSLAVHALLASHTLPLLGLREVGPRQAEHGSWSGQTLVVKEAHSAVATPG